MSCSANENAKTLTKGLSTAPPAHSPRCLWKNSSAGLLLRETCTPAIGSGLKGIGRDFKTVSKAYQGRRERGLYLLQGTSFQFLTGGGNFSSPPTRPAPSLGCEVCPEVLLALKRNFCNNWASGQSSTRLESERRCTGLKIGLLFFVFQTR